MALIDCHECSKGISDKAPNCPHCGAPNIYVVEGSEGPSSNSMKVLMKNLLKGVVALTVLAGILITVENFIPITSPLSSDMGSPFGWIGILLLLPAAGGILLLLCGAAGWFVVWAVSRVARDKGAGKVGVASGSMATVGLIILGTLVFNYMTSPPDGPYERYDENGQLRQKSFFKDGELDGPYEDYYENSQLWNKGTYTDGERHGPWESYHENGQLGWREIYKDGELDGPYESYFENGQLRNKTTYTAGEYEGVREVYFANGQVRHIQVYRAGVREDGRVDTYWENGQLESTGLFKDAKREGPYESYHENGQLNEKGTHKDGEPCGEWVEDGDPVTYDPCPPDLEGAV